jgi:ABC-type transport system involved in resistance to organic solvents, permease component
MAFFRNISNSIRGIGEAIFFLGDVLGAIVRGRVRVGEVLNQMYVQGVQSIVIVILTSLASGMVLGLQGVITLERFGAKEFIARLVALSLVRELGPVFTALIFSGKSGAGMTAELGTMNTHDQIQATRALGVDPIEFLVVPRFLVVHIVLPVLVLISEIVGIFGGYLIAVNEGHLTGVFILIKPSNQLGLWISSAVLSKHSSSR